MLEQIPPNSIDHLYGPEEVLYAEDELVLLCLLRDGRPYIKSFVEHYLSMGVKHLFFLDNGSTDGTVEVLKEYDNVSVLQTTLPFKRHEVSLRQYLIERFCQKGRWCLYADIDELFDYPYSDVVSLGSLLRYLNERSYTAVVAQMLDMFPEEPLSGRASNPDEPLKERHRFYDISNIRRENIKVLPRLRNNTCESDDIEFFYDGIRSTLFPSKYTNDLTKFPLVFSDGRVKPMDESSHWADNARVADLTCVLLHYKFLDGYFQEQAAQAVREEQYSNNSALYKRYLEVLESTPSLRIKRETARELRSVNELVDNQFLVVSEQYTMLVYDQQRKRGSGHAPRPGEPDGQDEAAFDRIRARAKVQSLRANRLQRRLKELTERHQWELEKRLEEVRENDQRHLENRLQDLRELHQRDLENRLQDLRELHQTDLENLRENNTKANKRALEELSEQNQRQLEKLREQYQRRIEKLSLRLARTKERTRKKNRILARQLRSMRASRSWRLLNKLARLRAEVPRRNITK